MPLILGIVASGNYPRVTSSYESIATVNASSASAVTFSSIIGTYKHLEVRISTLTSTGTSIQLQSNLGLGTNSHQLFGNGSSAGARNSGVGTYGVYIPSDTGIATGGSAPCVAIIDLLDYANTNKNKTVRSLYGAEDNSSGIVLFNSAFWNSTSAITSLTFTPNSGTVTGKFALYGIKG